VSDSRADGLASALLYLEWRQLVNGVRGLFKNPRRALLVVGLAVLAARPLLFAPGSNSPYPPPTTLGQWVGVVVGLALLVPWAFPAQASLYAQPADRTFLVAFMNQTQPLVVRHLWHRLSWVGRSLIGFVYLIIVFMHSGGILGTIAPLLPVAILYLIPARLLAWAVGARRIPTALLVGVLVLAWIGFAVRWRVSAAGIRISVNPTVAGAPFVHPLTTGNPWPMFWAWLLLVGVLMGAATRWAVPESTENWRLVDRMALVAAMRRGDSGARELWHQQVARRLVTGKKAIVRPHRFRWSGPGAVVEMEALTSWRQVTRMPAVAIALATVAVAAGLLMDRVGASVVMSWLGLMAYLGMLFTAVQSRLAAVDHPVIRDPLVIGAPGSTLTYVLAEEATGFAFQVAFWGGAVIVALVGGMSWVWGGWALALIVVGQFVIQSLRVLYWTLFESAVERQIVARLVSFVASGVLVGIPVAPILIRGWPTGVPFTLGLGSVEGALLTWWASRRVLLGRGPGPRLGEER